MTITVDAVGTWVENDNTQTISPVPPTHSAGALLIAFCSRRNTGIAELADEWSEQTSLGWDKQVDSYGNVMFLKDGSGSESTPTFQTTRAADDNNLHAVIIAFEGARAAANAIEFINHRRTTDDSTPPTDPVTTEMDDCMLVDFACCTTARTGTPSSGYTEQVDQNTTDGNDCTMYIQTKLLAAQGTEASHDLNFSGNPGACNIISFAIRPSYSSSLQAFKVLRGETDIADTTTTRTITEGVDYTLPAGADSTNCFIRLVNSRHTAGGSTDSDVDIPIDDFGVWISNPGNIGTSITFEREGSDEDVRITWEILCYVGLNAGPNEMIVRGVGTVSGTGQTLTGANVSDIDASGDCVVFITGVGHDDAGSNDWHRMLFVASLVADGADFDPTFVKDVNDTAGTTGATISYAVVEFTGSNWSVIRHEFTTAPSGTWTTGSNGSGTIAHGQTITDIRKAGIVEAQFSTNDDPTVCVAAGDSIILEDGTNYRVWRRSSANTHRHCVWILQNSQDKESTEAARDFAVRKYQWREDSNPTDHEWRRTYDFKSVDQTNGPNFEGDGNTVVYEGRLGAPLDQCSIQAIGDSADDTGTWYPRGSTCAELLNANQIRLISADAFIDTRPTVEIFEWPEDEFVPDPITIPVPTGPLY